MGETTMGNIAGKPFGFKWYDDFVAASVAKDGQLDFTLHGDMDRLGLVLVELMGRHNELAALLMHAVNQYYIGLLVNKKGVATDVMTWTTTEEKGKSLTQNKNQ